MDITLTREIVQCALTGKLTDLEYDRDPYFKVFVPRSCPGVPDASILNPRNTWDDPTGYQARAKKLAGEFAAHFEKAYDNKGIDEAIASECPGR
jgi:phosphoenolpyruvate carboxykinase (ATP)